MATNKRARIYDADTWHVDDGVGTDGEPVRRNPVRRAFAPEYKLAINWGIATKHTNYKKLGTFREFLIAKTTASTPATTSSHKARRRPK